MVFQEKKIGANNMEIFLSGNSSKSKRFQKLFEDEIKKIETEIAKTKKIKDKIFNINYPVEISKNKKIEINAKTGTAIGLLESRKGGRFKIIASDEIKNNNEINFQFYVGYLKNKKFKVVLNYKDRYRNWKKFSEASIKENEIYYIPFANSINGELPSDNPYLKRKIIKIEKEYLNEETFIYIQAYENDLIEYCVSTEKKIKKNEFIEEPQKLKLI